MVVAPALAVAKAMVKLLANPLLAFVDISKPDGTQKKLMNTNKINNLGWKSVIKLEDGIKKTIIEFLNQL